MKKAPYTFHEAANLSEQFKHIIGKSFAPGSSFTIQCVAIAPFDQFNKNRFLNFYFLLNDEKSALDIDYKGLLYDVLIIGRSITEEFDFVQEDIGSWLSANQCFALQNAEIGSHL